MAICKNVYLMSTRKKYLMHKHLYLIISQRIYFIFCQKTSMFGKSDDNWDIIYVYLIFDNVKNLKDFIRYFWYGMNLTLLHNCPRQSATH